MISLTHRCYMNLEQCINKHGLIPVLIINEVTSHVWNKNKTSKLKIQRIGSIISIYLRQIYGTTTNISDSQRVHGPYSFKMQQFSLHKWKWIICKILHLLGQVFKIAWVTCVWTGTWKCISIQTNRLFYVSGKEVLLTALLVNAPLVPIWGLSRILAKYQA